jgi:hypothetical protein
MVLRALACLLTALAANAQVVQFGIHDVESSPGAGWRLASAATLNKHRDAFVAAYNGAGLPVLQTFKSKKVLLSKTAYNFQFTAFELPNFL